MVGVVLTLALCICSMGVGCGLIGRWTNSLDPSARHGAHGLAGLGALGLLTLFIGLLPNGFSAAASSSGAPGGLSWGVGVVAVYALVGLVLLSQDLLRRPLKLQIPDGLEALFPLGFFLACVVSLAGVLTPSDSSDWDSLAYHLAVPKLYLQAGHIYPVFIHQSNFPSTVDLLYVWGLLWGGENGAKAFSFAFLAFGMMAVYGLVRARYGSRASGWATLAFAWVPVVLWESGTAYIDLGNGAFAGLGILFLADFLSAHSSPKSGDETGEGNSHLWLSAVFLGFAAGSKYTGLQTIFVCAVTLLLFVRTAGGLKKAVALGAVAALIACPWYIKTAVYTGNPVFPFFYERLGGKNWDQRRADIYRNQQQIFGVGLTQKGRDPLAVGEAVLGIDFLPGKYVDPDPVDDLGSPLGAIGSAIVLSFLWWLASGRAKRYEQVVLVVCGLSLLMWFFLSQQSRYIVPLVVPLAVLLGGGVSRLRFGMVLAGAAALQAVYSLYMFKEIRLTPQMRILRGTMTADEYRAVSTPFSAAAAAINRDATGGKVALYDEVFGFYLDVPYMWANPGHSTLIPYDTMSTGDDYAQGMKKLGFTHVYVNLRQMLGRADSIDNWVAASGLSGPIVPLNNRQAMFDNWETKYKVLISDAVAHGDLIQIESFRDGILFAIR